MTSRVGTPGRPHIGVGTGPGLRVSTDPRGWRWLLYAAHMAREGARRPAAPVVGAAAGALAAVGGLVGGVVGLVHAPAVADAVVLAVAAAVGLPSVVLGLLVVRRRPDNGSVRCSAPSARCRA